MGTRGGGSRGRVDFEGFGYAVDGDVDGVFVVGGEGAVGGGGGEEVADGEGETLLGGGLRSLVSGETWRGERGKLYHGVGWFGMWLVVVMVGWKCFGVGGGRFAPPFGSRGKKWGCGVEDGAWEKEVEDDDVY